MNYVNIDLDKPRRLKFDYNAICDAEDVAQMTIAQFLKGENIGFRVVRALLFAGLKWEQRNLTVGKVGELLQDYLARGGEFVDITVKISEAILASKMFKRDNEETEGNAEGTAE